MIDIKKARSRYGVISGEYDFSAGAFCDYAPAYVTTNEDLRHALSFLKPKGKSVLTVAGGGDQPLFFDLNGAKSIDTFDISFCAKVMMDYKVAAIKSLDYQSYIKTMTLLSDGAYPSDIPSYSKIQNYCTKDVTSFISGMKGCYIFRQAGRCNDDYLPFMSEYENLKKIVNKSYNFIWADLANVSKSLNKKYDLFYFSNIIQYNCDSDYILKVLESLKPFMNEHATVMLYSAPYFMYNDVETCRKVRDYIESWADLHIFRDKVQTLCMVKKR